jgi:phage gp29-like protein
VPTTTKRRPQARRYDPLPTDALASWSVQEILDALELHESGDFQESSKLVAAMGRDDRIRADRETRVAALVGKNGARFSIEPHGTEDEDPTPADEDAARWVRSWYFDAIPESEQRSAIRNATMLGVAYGPLSWTTVDGVWIPRVHVWDNQNLSHDGTNFIANTTTGPVVVSPEKGWFLYTPDGDRSWLSGAVRALGLVWKMRQFTWRDWARFCERHGMPLIKIKEPPGADDGNSSSNTAAFYRSLRSMGSTGIVKLPQLDGETGWDFSYEETKAQGHEAFRDFLMHAEKAISICILGQNVNDESGSYAKATAQLRVAQHFLDADAETLSTTIREQIVKPAIRFNRSGYDERRAPWPTWETGLPEDKAAKLKGWSDFATALDKLMARGLDVDLEAACEVAGIPLRSANLLPVKTDEGAADPNRDERTDEDV